jgi:hypothetical protein
MYFQAGKNKIHHKQNDLGKEEKKRNRENYSLIISFETSIRLMV